MAMLFSCCPWKTLQSSRVAPVFSFDEQQRDHQQQENDQEIIENTTSKDLPQLKEVQTNTTKVLVERAQGEVFENLSESNDQNKSLELEREIPNTESNKNTDLVKTNTATALVVGETRARKNLSEPNGKSPQLNPENSTLENNKYTDFAVNLHNSVTMDKENLTRRDQNQHEQLKETKSTGHMFRRKTFHKPTYCHHCSDMLWGLTNQGMQCTDCGYITHERCQFQVVTACTIKASALVQIPQLHSFIKMHSEKKKFCSVCRKKTDDSSGLQCQVCHYYVHGGCQKQVVHNCKLTSTYTSATKNLKIKQHHHWSEGHLPASSKCRICSKSCSSADCLTGLCCSWCLTTVHSYCLNQLPEGCNFGVLRHVVLPPFAVKDFNPNNVPSSQWRRDEQNELHKQLNATVKSNDTVAVIRIHEGPIDHPHIWKNIIINKRSTTKDVLNEAHKKFNIKEHKTKYYLTFVNENGTERKLEDNEIVWRKLDTNNLEAKQFFLRHVNLGTKDLSISVYAGAINTTIKSVKMKINIMSEARDIIINAMKEFGLEEEDSSKFCITQMKVMPNKVKETNISDFESLFEVLVEKRKQTVADMHMTRFYLQVKEPPLRHISLYVGNLPQDLSTYQYQYLLGDIIGKWDEQTMKIEVLFAGQGALVLVFNCIPSFLRTVTCMKSAQIEGKNLFLKLLPHIHEDMLAPNSCPLIVFVNSKSGGGQGAKLITKFKRLLNPYQIADLLDGGPLPVLYVFRNVPKFRILICGGDGTFGWVLTSLDDIRYNVLKCNEPASALLPLGTGNDLARILNWGGGYTGDPCINVLTNVTLSTEVWLDRWNIVFDSSSFPNGETAQDSKTNPVHMVPMNNYFGVGIDAAICLEFHLSREENPEKFNNRIRNKGVYVKASLKNLSKSSMSNLQDRLELTVDGQKVNLPSLEGITISNINSWGAGADIWGKDRDDRFQPATYGDGLLEIVGFTGVYHMGKIQGGLSTGIRIAQGSQINLVLKEALPVQVDGEPWLQAPCMMMVRPTLQQAKMLAKAAQVRSVSNATELRNLPNMPQPSPPGARRNTDSSTNRTNWYAPTNER